MKAYTFLCLGSILLVGTGCGKNPIAVNTPACISQAINANKNIPEWNVKSVSEYTYQQTIVYIFDAKEVVSDDQTTVVKSDCSTLCVLGGIAGVSMCNGENFYEKAVFRRKVWIR